MSFKYSVIGDNSQENREWLEKVGYKQVNKLSCPCRKIITYPQGVYTLTPISITNRKDVIDCTNNPQLFQAVSAIREGTDFGQIFIDDNSTIIRCMRSDISIFSEYINPRKLSLEELQERFKEKEG